MSMVGAVDTKKYQEARRIEALAFRLCEEWQKSRHGQRYFSVDEINAFLAGVKAAEQARSEHT